MVLEVHLIINCFGLGMRPHTVPGEGGRASYLPASEVREQKYQ